MALSTCTTLSATQNLLATLEHFKLKNMSSFLCFKLLDLDAIQNIVISIEGMLLDVEGSKDTKGKEAQHWNERLNNVVYDADDLFDKLVTMAEMKASQKNNLFFSRYNLVNFYKMYREVKKIREKLEDIANDHNLYVCRASNQVGHLDKHIIIKREDIYNVNKGVIIGREVDHEKIVNLLIDSKVQRDHVSFLSMVGMEGIGKTTLARLVYEDERVKSAFPLSSWICVSDKDQLNVGEMLCKILAAIIGKRSNIRILPMKEVKIQLKKKLAREKWLLVFDDVRIEHYHQWKEIANVLLGGHKGSWILVTTHSQDISRVNSGGLIHILEGLSKDKAWDLFKIMAFGSMQLNQSNEFVKIGHKIVEGCVGVPLAIRVAGSHLYGKGKSNWLSLQKVSSLLLKENKKDIMPILKYSYDMLESPLKSCFSYCAIFPKDYVINKEVLKSLWMAQGYIVAYNNKGQRMEDIAEEYFSILFRQCFFKDVGYDECGEIVSCKIHNLMHEMTQRSMENEICASNYITDMNSINVRHLSCTSDIKDYSFSLNRIRSFFILDTLFTNVQKDYSLKALLVNWMWLRALKVSNIKVLPDSIGNLVHLRYLDISRNEELKLIPDSIIKLNNLQMFRLRGCRSLKELPKDLGKVENLRILDIEGCINLTSMPRGICKLTSLHTLSNFVVGEESDWFYQLMELEELNSLTGKLEIKFRSQYGNIIIKKGTRYEGDYLKRKKNLNHIRISLQFPGKSPTDEEERLMEKMLPHPNTKVMEVDGFYDLRMPSWARDIEAIPNFIKLKLEGPWFENNLVKLLPNLIKLKLEQLCKNKLYNITCLGLFPQLKDLSLCSLKNLEYMFESSPIVQFNTEAPTSTLLYGSLERLELIKLIELKRWRWRSGVLGRVNNEINVEEMVPIRLSRLKELNINICPNLIANLNCPKLENLTLFKFNEELKIKIVIDELGDEKGKVFYSNSSNNNFSKLKNVYIDNVVWLKTLSMSMVAFQYLANLSISYDKYVQSLAEAKVVFRSCSSSLRYLFIGFCSTLRSVVCEGLEYLTVLETLNVDSCNEWRANEEQNKDGTTWKPLFHHSLHNLVLCNLPQLLEVPKWIRYLTSLQTLKIQFCKGIQSIPKWISKLTSLKTLLLWECSEELKKRCQESTGEDWPLIKHIPFVEFDYDDHPFRN